MKAFLELMRSTRIITWLGAFGACSFKPLELWTSIAADRFTPAAGKYKDAQNALSKDVKPLYTTTQRLNPTSGSGWTRAGWVSATPELAESSEYPWPFAQAVAQVLTSQVSDFHVRESEENW
jgi:hypothetical protein